MTTEVFTFRWLLWTILIALILGGEPWVFPKNGQYWLDDLQRRSVQNSNRESTQREVFYFRPRDGLFSPKPSGKQRSNRKKLPALLMEQKRGMS